MKSSWKFQTAGIMAIGVMAFHAAKIYASENSVVLGTTWNIAEDDMLTFIESRIRNMQENGEMDALQKQFQKRVREKVERPDPVSGIHRTAKPRTHWYDPSVVVTSDLTDDRGHVFARAGERFNPLHIHQPNTWLVFLDGEDQRQVDWLDQFMKRHPDTVKPVLISGSISNMSRHFHQPVYFDQSGTLTTRLDIHQVPAIVQGEQDRLRIDEVIP